MANISTKNGKIINLGLLSIPSQIILSTRPLHWIKNLSVFAALIFVGSLASYVLFLRVVLAFFAFSLAASATYFFNDILDAKQDKLHPKKSLRPIAAGKLPIPLAVLSAGASALFSLYLASYLSSFFFMSVLAYLCIQLAYSLVLKNIPVIDILVIASGFILRVYGGAFVINAHLSVWFLLCVISVALFLAAGKRRAELGSLPGGLTRVSLTKYKKELLNSYVTMFGNAAWMSWALFTFFESPPPTLPIWLFLAELSKTTTISKLLMITIPIVIFGIMRYQALIFEDRAESPEKLLLTDKSLVTSVVLWATIVIWIIYGGLATSF